MRETYGVVAPGVSLADLTGKLIVIEGTDGVGRSTQMDMVKPWLEHQGHAVVDTGIRRSILAGKGIKKAKAGHTLGRVTLSLFYATDFADRLIQQILPALQAGFVVLTDRYIYSLMARALARGLDVSWLRSLYSFALKPDVVFYLRIGVDDLIPRVVFSRGFDYWEAGMDLHPSEDMYESFRKYQTGLLSQFDILAQEYGFEVIDAAQDPDAIFEQLQGGIARVLDGKYQQPAVSPPTASSTAGGGPSAAPQAADLNAVPASKG
ncbi:MAG: thymidylate kinase [Acidobacteriota bacterium]|nr:thymidylate kinase [Acidobacteriota bacterium]